MSAHSTGPAGGDIQYNAKFPAFPRQFLFVGFQSKSIWTDF